ncbi:MAG: motility associated factor glycosyltransferase family protein [Clostridium sulfidigenes]|uniref:Motility associated factor glycosyltransferase family protein n=1 Tax=Clostridium sulfidigenes TaxID=318464 RepID=A0A927W7U9_9CLOT|nr:motility associated factor glycosyltransferase family protein [Clostridium sulfidigenes]
MIYIVINRLTQSNIDKAKEYKVYEEISKDNKKILRIFTEGKSIYLGSKYSVQRDIDSIKDFILSIEDKYSIIIGLGTGEYIKEIDPFIKEDNKLIIIEPNIEVYNKYIYEKENKYENITIISMTDENLKYLELYIGSIALKSFVVHEYPNYRNAYTEEVHKIYELIRSVTRRRVINRNTNIFFSKIWFESTISDLKYLSKSKNIVNMKNAYSGKPAVIVSAGPSLSKNISQLKQFEDKAVIFTGGRTWRTLIEEGIKADFLSIIDAHELSYELVDEVINKEEVTLVHSEILPNKVLKLHKGNRVFYPYAPWINDIVENPNYNFTHSSVAHTCTKLAMYMGCNPIIFLGQDLAYTDDKVHAENAEFVQEKYKNKEDITKVADSFSPYVEDIYGNKVRTSMTLSLFREQFEEIIKESPEIEFINSTEGGANIKGTEIKKFMDNKAIFDNVIDKKQISINYENMDGCISDDKIIDIIDCAINYLKELENKLIEAIKHNEKYYDNFISKHKILKSSLKVLEDTDKFIREIPKEIRFIEYLFADTTNTVLYNPEYKIGNEDTELSKAKKIYEKGKILYSNLLNEAGYALKYIKNERESICKGETCSEY